MKLGMQGASPWPHCVRWGPSSPSLKGAQPPPQFSAHVYCGQTAGWIKMPLGTKAGLSPGDPMLDGYLTHSPQRVWSPFPNFRRISIVAKRIHQDATWYGGRPQPRGLCARWGPSPLPSQIKEAEPPIFGPCLLWPNGWMYQDATWYGGRPQPGRLCVRWGPSPLPQEGRSPSQISAHVYCGQTAAWIKLPLGTEVGLRLRDIVFDVDPATHRKKGNTHPCPIFGQCLLWPRSPISATAELL